MGQVTIDGVIYEELPDGNLRVIGYADQGQPQAPQPQGMVIGRPAPPAPRQPEIRTIGDTIVSIDPNSGAATPIYTAPPEPPAPARPNATQQQALRTRAGNLDALVEQINRVQELFENGPGATSGIASLRDYLPTATNTQFDSASAGLAEMGLSAFRTPGVGSQSDAELRQFVEANRPMASEYDAANAERLTTLRNRVDATRESLGLPPARWIFNGQPAPRDDGSHPAVNLAAGPTVLPQAAGARGDGGSPIVGAAAQGEGYRVHPQLRQLSATLPRMIQQGASWSDVRAAYRTARMEAGYPADPAQERALRYAVDMHARNPRTPVTSLVQGWDAFGFVPTQAAPRPELQLASRVAASPVGTFLSNAANAATGGAVRAASGDTGQMAFEAARYQNPNAALGGDIAGSLAALTGINRAGQAIGGAANVLTRAGGLGGDVLYGAARGAIETDGTASDRLLGGLAGAGSAAVGNGIGQGAVSGLGRLATGVSDPAVRYLAERGVRMTPGQILAGSSPAGQGSIRGMFGRGFRAMEDAAQSVPFVGSGIANARTRGVEDFVGAYINDGLAPIGQQVAGNAGTDMIANAQQAIGDSYRFLDNANMQGDGQLWSELSSAINYGRSIPRAGEDFSFAIDRQIAPLMNVQGGLPGRNYQAILQATRRARSNLARNPDAMGAEAADALSQVENAFTGWAERAAPDVADQLSAANAAFRNLRPLENAAITATNRGHVATPAQINRAATTGTIKFGGRAAAARGDVPMADLLQAGQSVLPDIVPNSGSADRAWATMVLPAALGGSGYALGMDPQTIAAMTALGALYTRPGQQAAQAALLRRPDALQSVGRRLQSNKRVGGMFGAAVGAGVLPGVLFPSLP